MNFSVNRRTLLKAAVAGSGLLSGLQSWAESGPVGPAGVIYGFAPGDGVFPTMAAVLKELHGKYVPDLGLKMTYMTGNVGARAMESVLKAPPDGGSLLAAPSGIFTLVPHFRKLANFDPVVDLVPVAAVAELTVVLAIGPAVPASIKTVKDFVRWVRDNPLSATYGVPGMGTEAHLLGMALARAADISFKPTAYKGELPMVQDMLDSSLAAAFLTASTAFDPYREINLRTLAVSSAERWPAKPDVPTLQELGFSDFNVDGSFGLFASARTPAAKLQELKDMVAQAVRGQSVTAAVTASRLRPVSARQADYPAAIARERDSWAAYVHKQRLSLDS